MGITLEMQRLASNLTRQVAQFRIRKEKATALQPQTEISFDSEAHPSN